MAEPGGRERRVRPVWRRGAVPVAGADLDAVNDRFERDGAVAGRAELTGIWSGGQLAVEEQAAPAARGSWHPSWVIPPCPPPARGWPTVTRRGDIDLDYDLGDLEETGAAVAVTLFRPGASQAVLVIAARDVALVKARLRPQLGDSLCVVPSRWTRDQLDAVGGQVDRHHQQWGIYRWGPHNDDEGQAHIAAELVRVRPETATWAATLPAGILRLQPWLMPVRARA